MSVYPQLIIPVPTPAGVMGINTAVAQLQATAGIIPAASVSGTQISADTITATNIVAGTITATEIHAGTITATEIAAGTITAVQIMAGTITTGLLGAGSITASVIAAGTITSVQIAANTITAANIAAGTITTTEITANTITGGNIAANTITSGNIAAGTITGADIAANTITASLLSISQLSAVSASMGTVTGGIFQTNTSGARVMMGSSMTTPTGITAGIVGIDTGNNVTFSIDAATGNVTLKGTILTGSSGLGNIGGVTQNAVLAVQGNNLISNPGIDTSTVTPYQTSIANCTVAQDTMTYLTPPGSLKATAGTTANYTFFACGTAGAVQAGVPAVAYSFSVFVFTPISRTITLGIEFLNSGSALITAPTQAYTTLAGQWQRLFIQNQISPAGTAFAVPFVTGSGHVASEVHNYDNFLFVQNAVASGSFIIADSITATEIAAGAITASEIQAATITAAQIAAGTITSGNISANAITSGLIAAGAVTASKISVATLSAIAANIGTVTAGTITGVTITGATIQTAISGSARVVLDTSGVWASDSSGVFKLVSIDATNGLALTSGTSSISRVTWRTTNTGGAAIGSIYAFPSGSDVGGSWSVQAGGVNTSGIGLNAGVGNSVQAFAAGNGITLIDGSGNTELNGLTVGITSFPYTALNPGGAAAAGGISGNYIGVYTQTGSLPGFGGTAYPVLVSSYSALFIAVGGSYAANISPAGTYTAISGVATKANFRRLDAADILTKISGLGIQEWESKLEPGIKRIGPVAENFHAAFGLGAMKPNPKDRTEPEHEPMLAAADVAGVALLGVQELVPLMSDLQRRVAKLEAA